MGLTTRNNDNDSKLPAVFDIPLDIDIDDERYPEALKYAIDNVLNQNEVISAFQSFAQQALQVTPD